MDVFNKASKNFSQQVKASDLKQDHPYLFAKCEKLETKYGLRMRIYVDDVSLNSANRAHFYIGGRFLEIPDQEVARLNQEASKYVLIYQGIQSGANIITLQLRSDFSAQIAKLKSEATDPPRTTATLPPLYPEQNDQPSTSSISTLRSELRQELRELLRETISPKRKADAELTDEEKGDAKKKKPAPTKRPVSKSKGHFSFLILL